MDSNSTAIFYCQLCKSRLQIGIGALSEGPLTTGGGQRMLDESYIVLSDMKRQGTLRGGVIQNATKGNTVTKYSTLLHAMHP